MHWRDLPRIQKLAIALSAGVAMLVGSTFSREFIRPLLRPSVEEKLVRAANDVNSKTPVSLDEYTRMDSALAGPGAQITYFYTLIQHESTNPSVREFGMLMRPVLLRNYCGSDEMRAMRDDDVKLAYVYRAKDGPEVSRVEIQAKECKAGG